MQVFLNVSSSDFPLWTFFLLVLIVSRIFLTAILSLNFASLGMMSLSL